MNKACAMTDDEIYKEEEAFYQGLSVGAHVYFLRSARGMRPTAIATRLGKSISWVSRSYTTFANKYGLPKKRPSHKKLQIIRNTVLASEKKAEELRKQERQARREAYSLKQKAEALFAQAEQFRLQRIVLTA